MVSCYLMLLLRLLTTCQWHYRTSWSIASRSGHAAADAVHEHKNSWKCESVLEACASSIWSMCFNTITSNTGGLNGARTLLEVAMRHNLLWMACHHHMFEVLLANVFNVWLGTSTGNLFFKDVS